LVGGEPIVVGVFVESALEMLHLETQPARPTEQVLARQIGLVGEQQVVVGPEPALRLRFEGGLGGRQGLGVRRQGQVFEHQLDFAWISID
jgi:hypothetical protein